MKANRTVTAVAGLTAAGMVLWRQQSNRCKRREIQASHRDLQEALSTFEGEGGLVLS